MKTKTIERLKIIFGIDEQRNPVTFENIIDDPFQGWNKIHTFAGYWRNFFIVSGEVLTDAFGVPTTYKFLSIPMSRRLEFRRLILKLKPVHAWGVLMVTWI